MLVLKISTSNGDVYKPATLIDLQLLLRAQGLEVVPANEVNWSSDYPFKAAHLMRISLMTKLIADLQNRLLGARARQGSL